MDRNTLQKCAEAFKDYDTSISLLEWLRENGMLNHPDRNEKIAYDFAIRFNPKAKAVLESFDKSQTGE